MFDNFSSKSVQFNELTCYINPLSKLLLLFLNKSPKDEIIMSNIVFYECIKSVSTIFQLNRDSQFIYGGKLRKTWLRKLLTNFIT